MSGMLTEYSVLYMESGIVTWQYVVHAIIGMFFTTPEPMLTLLFAIVNGVPNGTPRYMMPLGFLVMIPFVGFAEETGWRGLLQPAMEEKTGFIACAVYHAFIDFIGAIYNWNLLFINFQK